MDGAVQALSPVIINHYSPKKKEDAMTTGLMRKNHRNADTPATSFSGLVDQIFQNNLSRFFDDDWGFSGLSQRNSVPVNVRETDKTYELDLVAPGLKKEDFKINVEGDLLTVSFEQKEEQEQKNENERWYRKEYKHNSFSRSFNMDDTMDVNKITATYADGILHLTLPKKEGAQKVSKNIEVK
jgi:HSP20 family protein